VSHLNEIAALLHFFQLQGCLYFIIIILEKKSKLFNNIIYFYYLLPRRTHLVLKINLLVKDLVAILYNYIMILSKQFFFNFIVTKKKKTLFNHLLIINKNNY